MLLMLLPWVFLIFSCSFICFLFFSTVTILLAVNWSIIVALLDLNDFLCFPSWLLSPCLSNVLLLKLCVYSWGRELHVHVKSPFTLALMFLLPLAFFDCDEVFSFAFILCKIWAFSLFERVTKQLFMDVHVRVACLMHIHKPMVISHVPFMSCELLLGCPLL